MPVLAEHLYLAAAKLRAVQSHSARNATHRAPTAYRFEPEAYIREVLGWEPWSGTAEEPGQREILDAYVLALRQQLERDEYQLGKRDAADLIYYRPDEEIKTWIRVEAGHTVGKTKLAAGMVNHFWDSFVPSIGYTFAPTKKQIHDLLWKEIKADRAGKGLPGRIMDLELRRDHNDFVVGTPADNAGGTGTERVHGQHARYMIYVIDEGEGVPQFIYDAMEALTSGGIFVVLVLGNPRTRTSAFYRAGERSDVVNFRISCLWHPNVKSNQPIIPDAVSRNYVNRMIADHCEVVEEADEDTYTFTVAWPVLQAGVLQPAGTVYQPDSEFMFRVLGVAPGQISDNTIVPSGRYDAAERRDSPNDSPDRASIGVDVARFGRDLGTIYIRHKGVAWRHSRLAQQDTNYYARNLKRACRELRANGARVIHVRVDGGGGFGGGVIDNLAHDGVFIAEMQEHGGELEIFEVHFNGVPYDGLSYRDLVTEMYADAAESLRRLRLFMAPAELRRDLTEREYRWTNVNGVEVRRLESKQEFRNRMQKQGRGSYSPDDGDGFVLAVASDYIFEGTRQAVAELPDDGAPFGVQISSY